VAESEGFEPSVQLVSSHVYLAVLCRVAAVAESNEVIFVVRTRVTAELLMVDFEVGH